MKMYDTFIQIDDRGGNIGHIHWINSDTSTPNDWWCGLPFPNKFWGKVHSTETTDLIQFIYD